MARNKNSKKHEKSDTVNVGLLEPVTEDQLRLVSDSQLLKAIVSDDPVGDKANLAIKIANNLNARQAMRQRAQAFGFSVARCMSGVLESPEVLRKYVEVSVPQVSKLLPTT